jgi:NADH-quinone oxidoreductase subunit N
MSSAQALTAFEGLATSEARLALAPLLALGLGVVLTLLCDVVDALRAARTPVFLSALAAAAAAEARLLVAPRAPGAVLDGTFRADPATAAWGLLFVLSVLLAWLASRGTRRESRAFEPEHDALLLSAAAGMMVMTGALDLVVFFVGLELLSLPLYALCAFRRSRAESVEAGLKYFLLGSFASALFLYGSALLYAATGSVSLVELARLDLGSPLALAGLALLAASLFFKVAVFPFHLWVPDVYQGSPTPVTGLMATGTKAAAFGFLVVQLTPLLPASGRTLVAVLALATMLAGNLGALGQGDLKRMLAYSSVAHAGTLLLLVAAGMGAPDEHGALPAAFYYLAGYLVSAMGAFAVLARLESEGRSTRLEALRGLAHDRPALAALLGLFVLSLGGIPATAGFLGKWFVFAVLVRADLVAVAVIGALLSTLALAYYLRVIVVLAMEPAPEDGVPAPERTWSLGLATGLCAALVLVLGLLPAPFLAWLRP